MTDKEAERRLKMVFDIRDEHDELSGILQSVKDELGNDDADKHIIAIEWHIEAICHLIMPENDLRETLSEHVEEDDDEQNFDFDGEYDE